MKYYLSGLTLLVVGMLYFCDTAAPLFASSEISPQKVAEVRAQANALILSKSASGQITDDALTKIELMVPKLFEQNLLLEVLRAVPLEQMPRFTNLVFDSVRQFAPKAGQTYDPKYEDAVRLAERLEAKRLAPLVFDHLALAPPYEFPTFELPGGWGDATLGVHLWKGTQGLIAAIVVRYGDHALMSRYRSQLNVATPKLKRVMVWALSRSLDMQDFETLWQIRAQASDPVLADIAKRALNCMPRTMEVFADGNDNERTNRDQLSPSQLKQNADSCRARLRSANLSVRLTIWD